MKQNNVIIPRISIIMGVYNCEKTIGVALDSLLSQTYKNFKIIICDDGSSDLTYTILKDYASIYSNIELLKNDINQGLNYTLNKCLEKVDTEYIARMDGDDISLPNRFQEQIKFLDENPKYAIVSSPMIYFDDEGDFKIGNNAISVPTKLDFIYGSPFCHAPSMIRTKAIIDVKGYSVGKYLLRVEDYHLWFKMYSKGYIGYNLTLPLYKMRDDKNAIKRRTFSNRINEAYVRHIGFKMLKLPFYYQIYTLRPLIVGLMPKWLYTYLHKK